MLQVQGGNDTYIIVTSGDIDYCVYPGVTNVVYHPTLVLGKKFYGVLAARPSIFVDRDVVLSGGKDPDTNSAVERKRRVELTAKDMVSRSVRRRTAAGNAAAGRAGRRRPGIRDSLDAFKRHLSTLTKTVDDQNSKLLAFRAKQDAKARHLISKIKVPEPGSEKDKELQSLLSSIRRGVCDNCVVTVFV